ncbi:MAG: hypothetical protein ACLP0J_24450 [Solirubrobacteraceae bacterium]
MTGTGTPQDPTTGAPGDPGDALTAFEKELIAAQQAAAKESPGDPRITAALQLGWVTQSVISGRDRVPLPADYPIYVDTLAQARGIQIVTLLKRISPTGAPSPDPVTTKLNANEDATQEADTFERALVAALLGSDVRLAKAYGVGRQLSALAGSEQLTATTFRSEQVSAMLASLDDLSSVLPSHAARGVAESVRRWQPGNSGELALLQAQCELWRTVLAGEKKCTELLEPLNYLDAAERLGVKLRAIATSLLKQYIVWVVLALALFLGGGAILLFAPSSATKTVAGLSAVLSALGLTWKGVGTTVGKLAGHLEGPLWGAEVDGAVADAITLGINAPRQAPVKRTRNKTKTNDYAGRSMRLPGMQPEQPGS